MKHTLHKRSFKKIRPSTDNIYAVPAKKLTPTYLLQLLTVLVATGFKLLKLLLQHFLLHLQYNHHSDMEGENRSRRKRGRYNRLSMESTPKQTIDTTDTHGYETGSKSLVPSS